MSTDSVTVVCACHRPVEVRIPPKPHWKVKAEVRCECGRLNVYVFPPAGWTRWQLLEVD